ncbi:hypothetical protein BHM03_00040023 [Ensete ventricosum]|nr:hypothetical protein BHM03_00040023 [Ensete ventricosum]
MLGTYRSDRRPICSIQLDTLVYHVFQSNLGNKRVELFDMGAGTSDAVAEENVKMASDMSNQELIDAGRKQMDETDQAIERSKMVVGQTVEVGIQTGANLKGQIVHPNNKNIRDIPGLAPPAGRKLLSIEVLGN